MEGNIYKKLSALADTLLIGKKCDWVAWSASADFDTSQRLESDV
jgi:hypothetical protein